MIVRSIHVHNFRSIKDQVINCNDLTALVGPNGAGKSSFLRALELFYSKNPKVDFEDFYDRDTSEEIVVSVTFTNLSEESKRLFAKYIQNDELTVDRVFSWTGVKSESKIHGSTLQNSEISGIRALIDSKQAAVAKVNYENLRKKSEFRTLPSWTNVAGAKEALQIWEEANPSLCVRNRDGGQFFGFSEVGEGFLGRFTRLIYIPAVRDASADSIDTKSSVFEEIMELVIRGKLAENKDIESFRMETKTNYQKIMDPSHLTGLSELSQMMTGTLKNFVPDAGIELQWLELKELQIDLPRAEVKLTEDSYKSNVTHAGHGLQRAFIMTMLQLLSNARTFPKSKISSNTTDVSQNQPSTPDLVFIIEEPELYQHPDRQRHMAKVLQKLAEGKLSGITDKVQVIYSTHSPHFVTIEKFENIRLLRKVSLQDGKPKVTRVFEARLEDIAEDISKLDLHSSNQKLTALSLLPRLHAIMNTWMNEGFFAEVVVLVEGEEDRAMMLGFAEAMGKDLESIGLSIIPVFGKSNFDKPTVIFRKFGIPVYLIWDSDEGREGVGADPRLNHGLLALVNCPTEDWPDHVTTTHACFKTNIEDVVKHEIGDEIFEKYLATSQERFGVAKRSRAIKNPVVIADVISQCEQDGKSSKTIQQIVDKVLLLKQ